jgi:CDP-glucose 4,6-dehydratase
VKVIVVITSDKCYENFEKNQAYVETDPLGGYDPYSSSKACAEHLASSYYRSFFKDKEVGLSTARSGNVIGGGDWSVDRLIPDTVIMWAKNETLRIRYPHATRPWQHVLEPLSGYLMLAEALWKKPEEFSGAWNFGPNQGNIKTVQNTLELAASEWGNNTDWETSHENHLHEANLLQLNSEKAQSLLGWKPRLDFEKSVHETILWYKEYYTNNSDMKAMTIGQIEDYEKKITNV